MSMALRLQVGAGLTALALVSTMVLQVSSAAFSGTTSNAGNSLAAGTVTLTDTDAGNAMFSITNMKPADSVVRCIRVTYTGSLAASVKVYGAVTAGTLGQYLDFTVERGSGLSAPDNSSCAGFVSAATIFTPGTVASFVTAHTDYSDGAGAHAVTQNDTVDYRFTATLQDNNAAQGLDSGFTVTWEAQNT